MINKVTFKNEYTTITSKYNVALIDKKVNSFGMYDVCRCSVTNDPKLPYVGIWAKSIGKFRKYDPTRYIAVNNDILVEASEFNNNHRCISKELFDKILNKYIGGLNDF